MITEAMYTTEHNFTER